MTTSTQFDPNTVQVSLVESTEDSIKFLEWLRNENTPLMGVDVETDGLNWFDGVLRLVQFGNLFEGWAVPFERFPELVREAFRIIFARRQHIVGHNMKFDLHWLERHAQVTITDWSLVHDTLLLASVCDSSGTKALKDLAEFYVHPVAKVGQTALKDDMKKGGWTWATVPVNLPSYWIYGVLDTILTVNLFYVLLDKAQRSGCMDAYATERGAMGNLYSQERRGLLVDGEYCAERRDSTLQRCEEIEYEVARDWGIEQIGSLPQLALAFERAGVELTEMTASGKWALNKEAFDGIVARNGKHPLVTLVHDYRKGLKMANAYYANFLGFQRSDGRVHPFYRQIQARTGRMSCTDPAMQTLPRVTEDANDVAHDVRNAFVADVGNVLISTDFSNVEARIFAHFAKEMGMQDAIKAGMDLHSYTAKQIFQLDYFPDKHDPLRQIAKNCLFCVLFGGGAGKLAQTGGVTLEAAEQCMAGLHRAFPGIKLFQRTCAQNGIDNLNQFGQAFIRGIDGRVLSMVETDDRYYAFTNWLIQSTAAVVLKQRLAAIDNMGLTEYCVATIHDEVVAEVPAEDEEDFKHAIAEAMNDYEQFDVPITAEPGKGAPRLGDAK